MPKSFQISLRMAPSFPGQRDIAHLPNEWIGIKDLETDTIIYGLALLALSRMKEGTV